MKTVIRIGTRGSPLAFYQAELVKARIHEDFPLVVVELVKIKTSGDMIRRGAMRSFETKRIFTREIEETLLTGDIDLAVHSAKDMAVPLPEGLHVGAVLEREDARDCLVAKDGKKISELPLGARIGTSSLRRKMQLFRLHPELIIEEVHGNVESRIRKVEEGHYDAVVLAYAGMKRLGLVNHVSEIFSEDLFYPAPGQGIIAIESRVGDSGMEDILKPVNHSVTEKRLECERAFLNQLEGGCQLPCGISTAVEGAAMKAKGAIFDTESRDWAEAEQEGPSGEPALLGKRLADVILEKGGRTILERIRGGNATKD
jgi:hydroxymethylbilane synthase